VKDELLRAVDEGREREAELEALVVDAPADPDGRWTVKDHLAHVSWWRSRNVQTLDAVRTGGALPPPTVDQGEKQNAIVYAQVKDRPAAQVIREARESWAALRRAIADSTEEDLKKPQPRGPEAELWELVPGTIGHSGTHVWSCLLDAGDEERAMEIARWGADVEARFFNTPEKLADSRYNLACVYARLGRADEAIPLLREALAANPELAAWARKDADLDRIREELAPILS
jgi:tetratricopeptide (TPR) repeat protein